MPSVAAATITLRTDPYESQQEADNELFRTILNIKTSHYTYVLTDDEDEGDVIW